MSRGLIILALIAVLTTPLIALALSAEGLAASLVEQAEPGVIDPVDSPCDDPGSLTSALSAHPLAALSIGLIATALNEWTGSVDRASSRLAASAARAESPCWPSPSRERRLSWLQTLLI